MNRQLTTFRETDTSHKPGDRNDGRLLQQIRLFEEILKDLQERFPEETLDVHTIPLDDTCISLSSESMHAVAETLVKCFDFYHLSTITGEDTGQEVVLLYHFWHHYGITLRTSLPYDQLSIDTLTDLIPGAAFYEREIYEMLGVIFEGHPNLRPLVSADDWDGDHPLRKP